MADRNNSVCYLRKSKKKRYTDDDESNKRTGNNRRKFIQLYNKAYWNNLALADFGVKCNYIQ